MNALDMLGDVLYVASLLLACATVGALACAAMYALSGINETTEDPE